jgi:hypothetical protein
LQDSYLFIIAFCGSYQQKTSLWAEGEVLLMQNSIVGGSTVIDVTADAVMPPRPALPSVVTT